VNEEVAVEYCNKKGAEMFTIFMNYLYCNREFKYVLIIADNTTNKCILFTDTIPI